MKYTVDDNAILVDGERVARIDVLAGQFNAAKLVDLIAAANRGIGLFGLSSPPVPALPCLVNDIDETGAGGFLAAHHVPIISPEIGMVLIKVVRRLEVVEKVYPLPPTVEIYRLGLHLVLQVAAEHQRAFCAKLERALESE